LEIAERSTWLYSEVLVQVTRQLRVGRQRVCLPTGAVQSQHAGRCESFTRRLSAGQLRKLRKHLLVTSQGQVGRQPQLQRCPSRLVEPATQAPAYILGGDVSEGRATPQCQGLDQ
jgi:hypothetical protein